MKRRLRILIFLSTIFVFGFLSTEKSFAASDDLGSNVSDVKLTITNNETGETKVIEDPISTSNTESKGKLVKGYEFLAPIEDSNSSDFTTYDNTGGSKTGGGVTANLYVDYNISGEKIRVNKVWGSWVPSAQMYYLTNRKVDAHSGAVWGSNLSKTPTANSFSYTTGWGYNYFAGGQSSPRAWTSAIAHVSGMSTTYTITLEITYP